MKGEFENKIRLNGIFEEYAPDIIYIEHVEKMIDEARKEFPKTKDCDIPNDPAGSLLKFADKLGQWYEKWFGSDETEVINEEASR